MIVGMINTLIVAIWNFFFILFFFYITSFFLLLKLKEKKEIDIGLAEMYVWGVFGGIDMDAFTENVQFVFVPIIFGTIFITIILLNILIAYLSEIFSTLESKQHFIELKEKAGIVLDAEVIKYFFRHCCRRKSDDFKISQDFYDLKHKQWNNKYLKKDERFDDEIILSNPENEENSKKCKKTKRTQLFVIKEQNHTSSVEVDVQESINESVKALNERFEQIVSGYFG
jgi:uncharacterized protein YdaU (DUF1376 family)